MTVLRAIGSDRISSLGTVLLVAVLSGTATLVLCAVTSPQLGRASAAPVVLLAVGALAAAAHLVGTVRAREPEVALARLRGAHGVRLVWVAVAVPALVAAGGVVLGLVGGVLAARRLARHWDAGAPSAGRAVLVAVAVEAVVVAVLVTASRGQVRRPLAATLARGPRRVSVPVAQRFAEILVLVAAVFVTRQAHATGGWWTSIAVVLLVYGGAVVVAWVAAGVLRLAARGSAAGVLDRGLAGYLTQRRLRRDPRALGVLRVIVAAGALLAVAAQAQSAASAWRDTSARLAVGGPVSYPVASALAAWSVAEQADPQGRWAMPIVSDPPDATEARRVFAGLDRWQRVVGDFLAPAPVTVPATMTATPGVGTPVVFTSDEVTLSGADGSADLAYVSGAQNARLSTHADLRGGHGSAATPGCAQGCMLVAATWAGAGAHQATGDGRRLTDANGQPLGAAPSPLDVVATPGHGSGSLPGLDGGDRPATVTATSTALPLVGTDGVLLDLGGALAGAGPAAVGLSSAVLVRADAPADVLARVAHLATGPPETFAGQRAVLAATPEARDDTLTLLAAGGAALVALLGLLVGASRLPAERRSEAAGLRAAGLSQVAVGASYRREAGLVALVAGLGTALAAAVAIVALGGRQVLVAGWGPAPAPERGLPWLLLLGVALGVALVVFLVRASGLRRALREGTPAILREVGR